MGNIRYCRQCGHALSDESRFCEYCGAKVEQGSRRVPVPNAQTRTDAENTRRQPVGSDSGSRRTPVQNAQPRRGAENAYRQPEVGDSGSRRTPVQNAQPRTNGESVRRQPGAGEQQRRMPQDTGERRTRYQQERLQGSWEQSWNRELPEEDERRITPVQYLLLGLIAILIAALVALGLFWLKGRSGNRNTQDGGNVQVAQTETVKTTAGENSGGDSVITILDGDGQTQSGTTKQTAAAETPKDQNAATEKTTERVTEKQTTGAPEKQTEKITEKQTEAAEDPTKQPQTQAQSGSYILPQSSERLLTDSDVDGMSYEELQMAINEIYARHGRKFSSQSVQNYFDGQSWYQGTVEPDDFSDSVFSQIEGQNVLFLLKKMGIE